MSKDEGVFSSLRRIFSPSKPSSSERKNSKFLYVLVLLGAGIAFMLVNNTETPVNPLAENVSSNVQEEQNEEVPVFGQKESSHSQTMASYEERYESELKQALENMAGVSEVEVIVNLDATESKVYEKDTVTQSQSTHETDREGGTRKVEDASSDAKLVIVRSGDQEKPVVIKTEKPKIRGVLIVAKGAENIQVKKWIIEAVTKSLDVPSHRVAVLPKKSKGE